MYFMNLLLFREFTMNSLFFADSLLIQFIFRKLTLKSLLFRGFIINQVYFSQINYEFTSLSRIHYLLRENTLANKLWIHYLHCEFTMNLPSLSRIQYECLNILWIHYESFTFQRIHYEFTIFFAHQLSIDYLFANSLWINFQFHE